MNWLKKGFLSWHKSDDLIVIGQRKGEDGLSGKKILVIEDDEAIIELLRFLLEEDGWKVQVVRDGLEALSVLTRELPDLVILDLRLPGMSGLDILREIREEEKWRDLPVIILTVDSSPKTMVEGWRLGVYGYFVKPFDPDELLHVTRRVLSLPYQKISWTA